MFSILGSVQKFGAAGRVQRKAVDFISISAHPKITSAVKTSLRGILFGGRTRLRPLAISGATLPECPLKTPFPSGPRAQVEDTETNSTYRLPTGVSLQI